MNNRLSGTIFFMVIVLTLFYSCNKVEEESFEHVVLETEQPVLMGKETHTAVLFSARKLLNDQDEILEQGFVYNVEMNPLIEGANVVSAEPSNSTAFSAQIKDALMPDTTYYVRSFLRTGNYLVYGNEVSFNYVKADPPKLNSLSSTEGTWGDTIVVEGSGFGRTTGYNTVKFGSVDANAIQSTGDSLWVVVPDSLDVLSSRVTVSVFGQPSENSLVFTLKTPEVKSISKKQGAFPDTITIKGAYFSAMHTRMKLGDKDLSPIEVSSDELRWIVPFSSEEKAEELSITQFGEDFLVEKEFKSPAQRLDSISTDEVWLYDTVTVYASNIDFSRIDNLEVLVEGEDVPVIEIENGQLSFYFFGSYNKGKETFNVEIIYYDDAFRYLKEPNPMFSFQLRHKPIKFEVVSEGPYCYRGRFEGKVTGFSGYQYYYRNISDGTQGEPGSGNLNWTASRIPKKSTIERGFYIVFPADMTPGTYEIWVDSYGRTSQREEITIVPPEITYVESPTHARADASFEVIGNYLPPGRSDFSFPNSSYYLKHIESGRTFDATNYDRDSYNVSEIIGGGTYKFGVYIDDVPYEFEDIIEIDDVFSYIGTYDQSLKSYYAWSGECFGFKLNDQIYSGFGSGEPLAIDLNTRVTRNVSPMGPEEEFKLFSDYPYQFFNGKVYSIFADKVYSFNSANETWEKESFEFGTDTIYSLCRVDNQLFAFAASGNVYAKGDSWRFLENYDVIRDSNFRYGIHNDGKIYFVNRAGIHILSLDTWTITEEYPVQWQRDLSYYRTGFHCFFVDNEIYLIYKNTGSSGVNTLIRKFSIITNQWVDMDPGYLPGDSWDYLFVNDEYDNISMLSGGFVYSLNP